MNEETPPELAAIVRRAVSGAWPDGQIEFEIMHWAVQWAAASSSAAHAELIAAIEQYLHDHAGITPGIACDLLRRAARG